MLSRMASPMCTNHSVIYMQDEDCACFHNNELTNLKRLNSSIEKKKVAQIKLIKKVSFNNLSCQKYH